MNVFSNGQIIDDPWVYVADDQDVPEAGAVIVSLERWRSKSASLAGRTDPVGVSVEPDDAFNDSNDRLKELSLVSVSFPKFTDGRSYSLARILRDQHGFKGEIRARGDVLSDQIPLMMRCGITVFEVSHAPTLEALKAGTLPGINHTYQSPGASRSYNIRRS